MKYGLEGTKTESRTAPVKVWEKIAELHWSWPVLVWRGNHVYFFPTSVSVTFNWMVWNQPWWGYLHHRSQQTLQIRVLFLESRFTNTLLAWTKATAMGQKRKKYLLEGLMKYNQQYLPLVGWWVSEGDYTMVYQDIG